MDTMDTTETSGRVQMRSENVFSESEQQEEEWEKYDYIEMYLFDVDGAPRGRLVSKAHFRHLLANHGLGIHAGACYVLKKNGMPIVHPVFGTKRLAGDSTLRPDMTTLTAASKITAGQYKVGQVICDITAGRRTSAADHDMIYQLDITYPRSIAKGQIVKLNDMGYTIDYSFEMRFLLLKADGRTRVDSDLGWGDMVTLMRYETLMVEFMEDLQETGVHCSSVHLLAGPSQFEFKLTSDDALRGADMAARFRKNASVFFEKKGLTARFLSYDEQNGDGNVSLQMHMNHCLTSFQGTTNKFNDGPNGISEEARHWLAGIKLHLSALMALFWPTRNCFKAKDMVQSLFEVVYSKHHRNSCFRRKEDGENVYLENRLPSSVANPYLVLAGTIAAGRHGLDVKKELTDFEKPTIPKDLFEALEALDNDTYLKKELGESFVNVFIAKKREDLGI